ncbi:unnamed protein product [Penicillium egyptiacum]|uniref:Peptidase M20 domain-containing protein 2 n=1 Tax=Penicillium egyptiacum TaxID=1303716 RepID=A0A9W4KEL1_9EURO|nr:unnamed protein product [Penicillium egyptiacum]
MIWSNPELAYEEHRAHDTICDFLEGQGFTLTRHAYGLDTSFEALSGTGGRLINSNAEYDALPGIGHACGHNLIATSSIPAFPALSFAVRKFNIPGRAQLLGTPAEENGGGKAHFIDVGAHKNSSRRQNIHPDQEPSDGIAGTPTNAHNDIHCEFAGRNAHAGGNPWEGINAHDALVSSYNVAVLRQQLLPDQRVHCAFLDTPKVANVILDYTKAFWQVHSPTLKGLNTLVGKMRDCIEADALATGCQVKIEEYVSTYGLPAHLPRRMLEGMVTNIIASRDELYTDVRLNDTPCERYHVHMGRYSRNVLKRHDKVLTGSSDIGMRSDNIPFD